MKIPLLNHRISIPVSFFTLVLAPALMLLPQIAKSQTPNEESSEYRMLGGKATVTVDLVTFGSGEISANVTLRQGSTETQILKIEATSDSLRGRQIVFPTNPASKSQTNGAQLFTFNGQHADSLGRGGLPNGFLLISVPESATHDRLVMINVEAAIADIENKKEFHPQEILVPRENSDNQRTYAVKPVAGPSVRTSTRAVGGTLLSIADVDKEGRIATFGTGLVVHQVLFLMDKNFTNLGGIRPSLSLRNDHSFDIIDTKTQTQIFRSLGIHHAPRHLPEFKIRDGRIDQATRFGGPIHPQIIEVICRQGSNGILSLPYLPLKSKDAGPITDLLASFRPEYKADLTIQQAALLPRLEISTVESVKMISDAILVKSSVTEESNATKSGLRHRQKQGLDVLASIASEFPPALEELKILSESQAADATLRAMAKAAVIEVERETKKSPKSLKAYNDLLSDVMDSSRCVRAFVPVK